MKKATLFLKKYWVWLAVALLPIPILILIFRKKKSTPIHIDSSGSDADYSGGSENFDHVAIKNALIEEFDNYNTDEDKVIALIKACPTSNDLAIVSDLFGLQYKDPLSWKITAVFKFNKYPLKDWLKGVLNNNEYAQIANKVSDSRI